MIDITPCAANCHAWADGLLLAESSRCLVLEETDHVDRIYFPDADVHWELFAATDHHTVFPFKGRADYWSVAGKPDLANIVWTYREPFPEVAEIVGYVGFDHERVQVVLDDRWPDGSMVPSRFPLWGDADELVRLIDVVADGPGRFIGPAHGETPRNVVEGGQLLAEAIVAAAKTVPDQRVISATMIFSKAASFDAPVDVEVEELHGGRSFSTVGVRINQAGSLRSHGVVLMDAGAPEVIRHTDTAPVLPGPDEAVPYVDFGVTGRDLRVIDAAYSPDPNRVGPAEINVWVRFRDAPAAPYLHSALLAHSTTHWTVAAAMRPHRGFGEADAHVSLSTGIMQASITFHDDVDVTDWLLYTNDAIWSGRGLAQGEGRVFTRDGRLAASYSVLAMIRAFDRDPASMGHDHRTAM